MLRRVTIIGMIIMVYVLGIGEVKGENDPIESPISDIPVFYESPKRIIPKPPEVGQPIIEEQIDQTEKLLLWLEELWKDEEVRKTIGEERLSEFISSVIFALTNPSPQAEQALETTDEGITMGMRGAPLGFSEIPGDTVINTNTVWDEDVHLNGKVYVDNAMLVIMPGVEVSNDPNSGIVVQNNGVITAKGLPNNTIRFISDAQATNEDYDFAIKIEETALSASIISYCNIQHAAKGIYVANNELDNPLENNTIENCYDGVVQYGPELTGIYNNLITNCSDDGVEISLAGPSYPLDPNGASSTTQIKIEHNLIKGSSYGVTVWGIDGPDEAGMVVMKNNLLSGCGQYAIYQFGWMATIRLSNGYYANNEIGNPQTDTLPVYLDEDPFVNGMETHPFVIIQDCNLVDAAYTYNEITYIIAEENIANTDLIGMSTAEDGTPDSGIADIGFHYPNWLYSNVKLTLSADIDSDSVVDANDLQILSENWLCVTDPNIADPNFIDTRPDLNGDDFVDFKDFALLSSEWLKIGGVGFTDIQPTFDGDIDNLSGYVEINLSTSEPNMYQAYVLLDGKKQGLFDFNEDFGNVVIQTECFTNGRHYVKIVGLAINGNVICSQITKIGFNNELSMVTASKGFEPGKDYYLYASGSGTYFVSLDDLVNEDPNIYTDTFVDQINICIPADTFVEEYGLYELTINRQGEKSGDSSSYEDVIARKFRKKDFPQDIDIRMVVSVDSEDLWRAKRTLVTIVVQEALADYIYVVFLGPGTCNWDNLSHCLNIDRVKMWYHLAHGDSDLPLNPPRECIKIGGDRVFSYLKKDFATVPPDYQNMRFYYENNHSIAELGFWDNPKFIWVQFNSCESAATTEFPTHLGMTGPGQPQGGSIFIGWKEKVPVYDIIGPEYNKWEWNLWDWLGRGFNLQHAYDEAGAGVRDSDKIETNFMPMPNGPLSLQHVWFNYPRIDTAQ